jgi:hypothetical protein
MALKQFGSQQYVFGLPGEAATLAGTIGLKPQEVKVTWDPEFEAEGKNTFAETEAYVKGSPKGSFTMSGYIVNLTLFNNAILTGTGFTFGGKAFIIKGGSPGMKSTEFQMGEFNGVSFPNISDTTGTALN